MDTKHRIHRVSKRFSFACISLMGAIFLIITSYWIISSAETLSAQWLGSVTPIDVTPKLRSIGLGLTLIVTLPVLLGLNHLRHLFLLYSQGTLFSKENVRALRGLGRNLICFAVAQFFYLPIMTFLMSTGNPPGERILSISISTGMLEGALVGGLLQVIGWVMNEARQINEEQQWTV